jgi:hypothetical protein
MKRYSKLHQAFERFAQQVEVTNTCWVWRGERNFTPASYPQFNDERGRTVSVHQFIYAFFCGSVSRGLELDHICENKSCVNPRHLEPVTPYQNKARHWQRFPVRPPRWMNTLGADAALVLYWANGWTDRGIAHTTTMPIGVVNSRKADLMRRHGARNAAHLLAILCAKINIK